MGRPKGSKNKPKVTVTDGGEEVIVVASPEKPEKFTFKSKYRRDKVTLKKAIKTKNPDGSMTVLSPQIYAEFDRNNWATTDPELAELMRKRIADGLSNRSGLAAVNIVETTEGI